MNNKISTNLNNIMQEDCSDIKNIRFSKMKMKMDLEAQKNMMMINKGGDVVNQSSNTLTGFLLSYTDRQQKYLIAMLTKIYSKIFEILILGIMCIFGLYVIYLFIEMIILSFVDVSVYINNISLITLTRADANLSRFI